MALDDTCFSTGADGSWLCSAGAVRENSIYDGELYDARLEKAGWRDRGYRPQPQEWSPAVEAGAPAGRLVCQLMPSIEVVRELKPAYLAYTEDEDYKLVADFGENIAGWVQIRVKMCIRDRDFPEHMVHLKFNEWHKLSPGFLKYEGIGEVIIRESLLRVNPELKRIIKKAPDIIPGAFDSLILRKQYKNPTRHPRRMRHPGYSSPP